MAERQILQNGTVPTIDSKGRRTESRPMDNEDRERIDGNQGTFAGMIGNAESALRGRKKVIDDTVNDATHVHYGASNLGSSTGQ